MTTHRHRRRIAPALVAILVVAALAALTFAACGSKSSTGAASTGATSPGASPTSGAAVVPAAYVGTWELSEDDMKLDPQFKGYEFSSSETPGGTVTVAADGTVTMTGSNGTTWKMDGAAVKDGILQFATGGDFPDTWGLQITGSTVGLVKWDTFDKKWNSPYALKKQ